MKKIILVILALFTIFVFASCDMNSPDNCDGKWQGSGTNEDGSTFSVYIYVYNGFITAFQGSAANIDIADDFYVGEFGQNGTRICEIYYDEEIRNYTNTSGLFDESLYDKDADGYLLGVDGYYFEYNDGFTVFSGYFHPDINKVEGHFGIYGTYKYSGFVVER